MDTKGPCKVICRLSTGQGGDPNPLLFSSQLYDQQEATPAVLISDETDFKTEDIPRERERLLIIKDVVHEEDKTILNLFFVFIV